MLVDKTVPGAAAVNQKGKWDYLIGVGLACFIGLLNGSLSGESWSHSSTVSAFLIVPVLVIGAPSQTANPEMLCTCSAI